MSEVHVGLRPSAQTTRVGCLTFVPLAPDSALVREFELSRSAAASGRQSARVVPSPLFVEARCPDSSGDSDGGDDAADGTASTTHGLRTAEYVCAAPHLPPLLRRSPHPAVHTTDPASLATSNSNALPRPTFTGQSGASMHAAAVSSVPFSSGRPSTLQESTTTRYLVHTTDADWSDGGFFGARGIATTDAGCSSLSKKEQRRADAEAIIAKFMEQRGGRGRGYGALRGRGRGGGRVYTTGGATNNNDGENSDDSLLELEAQAEIMQACLDDTSSDSDSDTWMMFQGRGRGRGGRGFGRGPRSYRGGPVEVDVVD